jgi:hypothetical protein
MMSLMPPTAFFSTSLACAKDCSWVTSSPITSSSFSFKTTIRHLPAHLNDRLPAPNSCGSGAPRMPGGERPLTAVGAVSFHVTALASGAIINAVRRTKPGRISHAGSHATNQPPVIV